MDQSEEKTSSKIPQKPSEIIQPKIQPVSVNNFSSNQNDQNKNVKDWKDWHNKKKGGNSKYGNEITIYNGEKYDSRKEAAFARDLDWQQKAAAIRGWDRQVKIEIKIGQHHICDYFADFKVYYCDDSVMFFDVKGYKKGGAYNTFKIKKRLILALYNIEIHEV